MTLRGRHDLKGGGSAALLFLIDGRALLILLILLLVNHITIMSRTGQDASLRPWRIHRHTRILTRWYWMVLLNDLQLTQRFR